MAWTAPRTYLTGEVITASILNTDHRDNLLAITALLDLATSSFTDGGILLGSGSGALTAMSVLADGEVPVGDGVTDPVAIALLTSSTGLVTHERGGIELDISGITTGGLLHGASAGLMAILAAGSDGQIMKQASGLPSWADAGFAPIGSDTSEGTTTGTSLTDLLAVGSLSIAATIPLLIIANWRKTSGAARGLRIGLKINSTEIGQVTVTNTSNAAADGIVVFFVSARVTNYTHSVLMFHAGGGDTNTPAISRFSTAAPNATVTDIVIQGQSTGGSGITIGADELRVYQLA